MVPGAGLEPARSYKRGILNPLCLPIPPPGHKGSTFYSRDWFPTFLTLISVKILERLTRLELVTFTLAT